MSTPNPQRDYAKSLARILDTKSDRDDHLEALLTINRMCVDALMDAPHRDGAAADFARTVGSALAAIDERRYRLIDGDDFVPVFSMTDVLRAHGGESR